jgi:Family of unknown function (DUF6527)
MGNWLSGMFKGFLRLFKTNYYKIEHHEELPVNLKGKILYVLGEKNTPWSTAMLCPCGCKEKIQLSLLKDEHPSWEIYSTELNKTSLKPSIWRQKGCKSHFFFTNNEIIWCD